MKGLRRGWAPVVVPVTTSILAGCAARNDSISQAEKTEANRPSIAETKVIAEEGFIYGLPLVMAYGVMHDMAVDKNSGNCKAPFNEIANEHRVFTYIAKFAVRGMTESLWSELEGTGVRAVCVQPGGIRTNIERASRRCANAGAIEARTDAANKHTLRTPPERCAADILDGIRRGRRRIVTGYRSTTVDWLARLIPNSYPALFGKVFGVSGRIGENHAT